MHGDVLAWCGGCAAPFARFAFDYGHWPRRAPAPEGTSCFHCGRDLAAAREVLWLRPAVELTA